jgi:hypothetical protein
LECKFSHAETLPFEVATDARSTVSLLSCYSQYSPELKSRLSLTADELDDLQLRWEKHADIFRALVKKTEYPADNSNTGETPLLAPAYLLLPTPNLQHAMSPQNSSIVRASTPDAPLHVHPLGCSPLSTPSPHPHSGPRSLQVEVAVIQNSSIVRASTPHAPLQVHPLGGSPLSTPSPHPHSGPRSRIEVAVIDDPEALPFGTVSFPASSIPKSTVRNRTSWSPTHARPSFISSAGTRSPGGEDLRSLDHPGEVATHASMPISPSSHQHYTRRRKDSSFSGFIPRKLKFWGLWECGNGP